VEALILIVLIVPGVPGVIFGITLL